MGDVFIRRALESDATTIVALLEELGYAGDATSVGSRIANLAAGPCDAVFVASIDGAVLGVASVHLLPMFHTGGAIARLTALVVAQRCRRTGLGAELVQAVERFALEHDCERMELTSGDHRTGAHTFYERLGYERVSQRFVKTLRTRTA